MPGTHRLASRVPCPKRRCTGKQYCTHVGRILSIYVRTSSHCHVQFVFITQYSVLTIQPTRSQSDLLLYHLAV